jgi:hypothetical protein
MIKHIITKYMIFFNKIKVKYNIKINNNNNLNIDGVH